MRSSLFSLAAIAGVSLASPYKLTTKEETRSLDEIYQAAVAEGGVVTLWAGGDEKNQQDSLKRAFEARFPKMTLNVTVDVSKYHDGNLDLQLAAKNVYIDSIILQTLHDFPRWKKEGALLPYAPKGFNQVYPDFKDADAAYLGVYVLAWSMITNTNKTGTPLTSFDDFIKPEFKNKLALTYPNDDDAVLWQFDLLLKDPNFGLKWFDALVANNPRWVRGTATPRTLLNQANSSSVATFTSSLSRSITRGINNTLPTKGSFASWPQTGAILKDAPHPEGAKLLFNYLLSNESQSTRAWSVRQDFPAPAGGVKIMQQPNTNPREFAKWMEDREYVERLRFFFEDRLGTAQGLSPLEDNI